MGRVVFGREGRYVDEMYFFCVTGGEAVKYVRSGLTVLQAHRKGHDSPFICLFIQKVPQISLVSSSG